MTDAIPTEDLVGAVESLDAILDGLRTARTVGIEVTVEQLALIALCDPDNQRSRARLAVMLAICLPRLTDTH